MQFMYTIIVVSILLQVLHFYYVSKGRLVYPLILTIYAMYCVVEGWLAWRDPDQALLWGYVGLNLWAMWCAARGWRRSSHEQDY